MEPDSECRKGERLCDYVLYPITEPYMIAKAHSSMAGLNEGMVNGTKSFGGSDST